MADQQQDQQQTINGDGDGGRKRDPVYNVFERRDLYPVTEFEEGEVGGPTRTRHDVGDVVSCWELIAENVKAGSDRAAIEHALDQLGREGDDRLGTFWAPLAGAFKPRTRGTVTRTETVWS